MPIIEFTPRDLLVGRATVALRELARFDTCDLTGEFERERLQYHTELDAVQADAKKLGEDWSEIYSQAVYEVEIYESDPESPDE